MASTPAVGPRPTARTNNSAQTISGMLRSTISSRRTGQRRAFDHQRGRPPRASADTDSTRVASSAQGTASSQASAMPAVAMARVSRVARPSRARNSPSCAGGQKAARKLPMVAALPGSNSTARFSSLSCRPGHSRARASTLSSRRGRAAGSRRSAVAVDVFISIAEWSPAGAQGPAQRPAAGRAARWRTGRPAPAGSPHGPVGRRRCVHRARRRCAGSAPAPAPPHAGWPAG
ncbi:hypothetical protein D3C81_1573940 [compost metagenome]